MANKGLPKSKFCGRCGRRRVADICRENGISEATYYICKKKYSGLGLSELRELRQLREENSELKLLVADLSARGESM